MFSKIKYLYLTLLISLVNINVSCQKNIYEYQQIIRKNDTINYRLLVPNNYDEKKKYPMLLFLHGAGERGSDNELQLIHGSSLFTENKNLKNYSSFVVFPQCDKNDYWASIIDSDSINFSYSPKPNKNQQLAKVEYILNKLIKTYSIDKNRIYVGGLSMGGMGTFEMVFRNPETFAAAFAICGGANPKIAKKISSPSWYIYHGRDDQVVPIEHSVKIYKALEKENSNVFFKKYESVKHNSWENVFKEPNFLENIYSNRLK